MSLKACPIGHIMHDVFNMKFIQSYQRKNIGSVVAGLTFTFQRTCRRNFIGQGLAPD
jgi:hypothetical protein